METAAVAVPLISSVASAGASVAGAMQSSATGGSNRQLAEMQAQRDRQRAAAERDMAETDAEDIRIETRRGLGTIRASAGAAGLVIEEGNPLEALLDSAAAGELNVQRRLWQGEVRARGYEADAEVTRATGILAERRAQANATGGYLQAGASLLTGLSRAKGLFDFGTPGGGKDGPLGGHDA